MVAHDCLQARTQHEISFEYVRGDGALQTRRSSSYAVANMKEGGLDDEHIEVEL